MFFYLKADKGNRMVIMDKTEYRTRMASLITDSSFKELKRSPLGGMIIKARDIVNAIHHGCEVPKWKLTVYNPQLPLLYGQPKIHKEGNKMRPVIASYTSPFYKFAQWIVDEFNQLPQPPSRSVKNTYEFVDKVKQIQLQPDEILVSYDVTSLYPNVPIPDVLQEINNWLFESDSSDTKADLLFRATKLCMEQNFFQYYGKFYKQMFGANMGNPLSCFVANIFLDSIEAKLTKKGILPKTWIRYVDDIFAVIKKSDAEQLKQTLNSQPEHPTIQFTLVEEENGKLPFLDLMLTRMNDKIDIGIYRKPTATQRFITNDSYCPKSTKMAAFNSMVFRMCKLRLSISNFMREQRTIRDIASVNGYTEQDIDELVDKHSRNIKKNSLSTLFHQNKAQPSITRASFKFIHSITNHLKPIFKKQNIQMVFSSTHKTKDILGNPKDKLKDHQKSGIYGILCSDCQKIYVGQTRRNIKKI